MPLHRFFFQDQEEKQVVRGQDIAGQPVASSGTESALFQRLMIDFARRTGLISGDVPPRRYLWTDAFAVCNFLGLYTETGEEKYRELALLLVDQVHHTLGRHRDDDHRSGWISGLGEQEGERHPTIGGLRIGKGMNERTPDEPYDQNREWDRDGQYFHYLTRWMHALNRVSRVTGDRKYNRWAIELALTAHARFIWQSPSDGQKRMYWKMSIDLSRPLVSSMGQQDPLDGYLVYNQLHRCLPAGDMQAGESGLQHEIQEMAELCAGKSWVTDDVLGVGGLLGDAWKVAQMSEKCGFSHPGLLENLLQASLTGLLSVVQSGVLELPAVYRLPFREFGLSIGLQAVSRLAQYADRTSSRDGHRQELLRLVEMLSAFQPLVKTVGDFWQHPANRQADTWEEHLDINSVMYATSLSPDGFLTV